MSKELNLTDALVYSALYSRTTLSEKNGWIDADGRIYIFYSIENLSEDLHKGQTVIKAAIRKLIAVGLIETKRNFGAPSTIYVKLPNGRNTDQQSVGKPTEQGSENRPLDSRNSDRPSVGFPTTNYSNRATRDNSSSTIAAAPRTNSYWTKSKSSYMCEDCAKAVKSSSVLRMRVCARCGAEFEGYPRSKYCPKCKPEVEREQAAERRKRKPRKIGSEDICEACGKPYIVKSGLQKYCPECAKTVVPETIREHKREYMAEHSEEFNATRQEKRSGRLICKVCGKPFESRAPGAQTCSLECAEILKKQAQQRADKKRGPRPPRKKSVEK